MTTMEDEKWVYWRNKAKQLKEENKQLKFENKDLKSEISWIQDCAYWQKENAFDTLFGYYMKTCDEYRLLLKENKQLKEELEQYKAVIDKKWGEYLKKHEMI